MAAQSSYELLHLADQMTENSTTNGANDPVKQMHSSLRVISVQHDSPVAFSPDGMRIAFAGNDTSVVVNERRSNGQYTEFALCKGMADTIKALCFHPVVGGGGAGPSEPIDRLYAAGVEGIFVWQLERGRLQPTLRILSGHDKGHDGPVECLCWVFGGSMLISGGKDSTFKVWDAERQFRLVESNDDHKASVLAAVFSEAACLLATTGRDSQIKVWDATNLGPSWRARRTEDTTIRLPLKLNLEGHRGDVTSIGFAQSGKTLFSGARDNAIKVWDLASGLEMRVISGHKADVRCVQPMNNDALLVSASLDGTVRFYELGELGSAAKAKEVDALTTILTAKPRTLAVNDDPSAAPSAPADSLIHSFEAHDGGIYAMALNPVFPVAVTTGRFNSVRLWSIENLLQPTIVQESIGHSGAVSAVRLCQGGDWVATASTDYNVCIFNSADGTLRGKVHCGTGMYALCSSPDASLLVAGGNDYKLKVIPVAPSAPTRFKVAATMGGHSGRINCLACSADGRYLASVSQDFTLRIWPLRPTTEYQAERPDAAGRPGEGVGEVGELCRLQPHKAIALVVCWGPESSNGLLATGSADHDISTWRFTGQGQPTREWHMPAAHNGVVSALTFGRGPSARLLFSASWDYAIKAWDYASHPQVALKTLLGHSARVSGLAVSTEGAQLCSSSGDGTLRVWSTSQPFECQCECVEEGPSCVVMSVDAGGAYFVSGSEDGCVRLWSLQDAL